METVYERTIPFEACFNFRDLGGYRGLHNRRVRPGRLFRSMAPTCMTLADVEKARRLNIGLVIDLRGSRYTSSGPLGEPPARRVAVGPSFLGGPGKLPPDFQAFMAAPPEDALPRLLQTYAGSFANALAAICSDPDANVLFHCRLGKDRTGVFSALLLKLLHVGDADIIEDYMLTALHEPRMKDLLGWAEELHGTREPRVAREPVSRRAMEAVLERLESQYGTAYNYFSRNGISSGVLGGYIESMLEPLEEWSATTGSVARSTL